MARMKIYYNHSEAFYDAIEELLKRGIGFEAEHDINNLVQPFKITLTGAY